MDGLELNDLLSSYFYDYCDEDFRVLRQECSSLRPATLGLFDLQAKVTTTAAATG